MDELTITSLRFAVQKSFTERHPSHKLGQLLRLFGLNSQVSGEETLSPLAGNVKLSLFGQPLTLRLVGATVYLYLQKLAAVDGGRPWIRLGRGGLAELFTVNGHITPPPKSATKPNIGEPTLAEPPFTGISKFLAGAREVRELGPGTVDDQPVTSFLATLNPSQLEPSASSRVRRRAPQKHPLPHLPQPTATFEVSLAQNGLPVRSLLTEHIGEDTLATTVEIPAVNFPLVIEAPPTAQTISLTEFRKLAKRAHKSRRHRKSK